MPEGRNFNPDDQSPALPPRRFERSPTVHQRKRAERVLGVHGNPFGDQLPDSPPLGNQPVPRSKSSPRGRILSSKTNGRQATTNRNPRPPINQVPA